MENLYVAASDFYTVVKASEHYRTAKTAAFVTPHPTKGD